MRVVRDAQISIHALLAESDSAVCRRCPAKSISIHALLAESDGGFGAGSWPRVIFLSTLSLRRATAGARVLPIFHVDFYPRSPCGERRCRCQVHPITPQFLSTLSLRRATWIMPGPGRPDWHFYPRSPCGERLQGVVPQGVWPGISIHALLAESDRRCNTSRTRATAFLSTLSLRRATPPLPASIPTATISIHALLAESDPLGKLGGVIYAEFLSTLSLRRAT